MPRAPLHALIWSRDHAHYALYTRGQLVQRFQLADDATWLAWLDAATSFAFHGAAGHLNVYREARPRGGYYWYAYHTAKRRTRKRYVGPPAQMTFAHLEAVAQTLSADTAREAPAAAPPAREDERPLTLLAIKLSPPRLPYALVTRKRLLDALGGALVTPVTLLSASAGWGKTTLLSAWANRQTAHIAWLSLDAGDNNPTRFWVALIAALRTGGGHLTNIGETAVALLQSPQPPPLTTILTALLNELESWAAHPVPLVLMLDDYQTISDPAIQESLRFFLEHLPAHLHLIVSTRVDPDLPLARLRSRGQLTEIRMDDLRFREEEATDFLGQLLSPALSDDEVHRLTLRTEGWVAGLQLAALALRKRTEYATFLQAFTGSQRFLLDYVQEDILARQPAEVRAFLLQIAILSRLDAAVCQVVTAAPDRRTCQQMLEGLERANLFLVPLDEERRYYRLHDLFREALLATLHTTQPELAPVLHRLAASFYEAQGEWAEAIAHRLAAADFHSAACLMEQTVEQFWERGEAATMAHWVLALPQSLVREHARLVLTTALYLLNTVTQTTQEQRARVHQTVRQLMARVETAMPPQAGETAPDPSATGTDAVADTAVRAPDGEASAAEEALVHRRLRLLRLHLAFSDATASGDHERLNRMEQEFQEALDRDEEAIWQMVPLAWIFVLHYTVRQEGARLVPRLLDAKARVSRSGSHFATIKVMQYLACAALEAGQLRLAYEESQAALDMIEQIAGYALLKGYFEMVQIEVLYQWNRLEEARRRLHTFLYDAATWQHLDALGAGYLDLMRVELVRGDRSAAEQALRELEDLVRRERFGTYPGVLPAIRAQWWLAQGQVADACAWASGVVFPEGAWESSLYYAFPFVVRAYFAQCRWREALELLERWSGHLDRPANIGITITFLAQLLVALHQTGKSERARNVAARLFALTEPEGYIRVYLDEGEPMRQALLALLAPRSHIHAPASSAPHTAHAAYISTMVAAFDREQPNAGRSVEAGAARSQAPTLTLTGREQDVLRLLAAGSSNQEIAQALMIELSTVKKHVSNLLSKLGATSRTQAIVQARTRSLL